MEISKEKINEIDKVIYDHVIRDRNYPRWRDHALLKNPADLVLYQQVIYKRRPDFIVETGTKWGGSALFFADMCELVGNGHVISIDINPKGQPEHKRITYLKGSSIDREMFKRVSDIVQDKSVMVSLDSRHTRRHVKMELYRYSRLVTPGQYLVVEDCYNSRVEPSGVIQARDWFLKRTRRFRLEDLSRQFLVGLTRDGWMRRR